MHFKLLKNKEKTQEKTVLKSQKSHKKTREKSLGRSMVEMLGVLAIIGVLSIGGIMGYTIAMRKYRANEIITIAEKYAFILYENALAQREDFIGCYKDNVLDFSETGLGALPNGLKSIQPSRGGDLIGDYSSYLCIIHKNSGDLISLELELDSKELCQTINNMMDQIEDVCQGEKYLVLISFYVN